MKKIAIQWSDTQQVWHRSRDGQKLAPSKIGHTQHIGSVIFRQCRFDFREDALKHPVLIIAPPCQAQTEISTALRCLRACCPDSYMNTYPNT